MSLHVPLTDKKSDRSSVGEKNKDDNYDREIEMIEGRPTVKTGRFGLP